MLTNTLNQVVVVVHLTSLQTSNTEQRSLFVGFIDFVNTFVKVVPEVSKTNCST